MRTRILAATILALGCTPTTLPNTRPLDGGADAPAVDVAPPDDSAVADSGTPTDAATPAEDVPSGPDVPILDVPPDAPTTACTRPQDCAAPFSACDVVNRRCVQCLTAAQCGAGQVCVANRCAAQVPCMTSRTCSGLVCDTARGVCVECLSGVDCPMGQECRAQSCAPPPPACTSSRQCSMFDQVCDLTRMVCVECVDDRDCLNNTLCTPEHVCRPQVCTPNATRCLSATRMSTCDARGAAVTERDCGGNETCAANRCQARVCAPGAASCASATMTRTCNPDGLGFTAGMACPAGQTCAEGACTACDNDGDGDDDGISDTAERARGTNPCARDSDGDGATDLVERVAGTDPTNRASVPGGITVELPVATGTEVVNREITVTAGRRALDVMFLVDSTGSMQPTITELQRNAESITTTILGAIGPGADVRFGVADYRDFGAESMAMAQDYALGVQSPLSSNVATFSTGLGRLTLGNGGDASEALVPALHALVEGTGYPAYRGTATRTATPADCGGDARGIGWACHFADRLAVFVAISDAGWHNPPGQDGNFYNTSAPNAPRYADLVFAMRRRGARYVAIDVGGNSRHLTPSIELARDTDSFDNTGSPTTYAGTPTGVLNRLANTLAGLTAGGRPDYTARGVSDPTAVGLPTGRNTGMFLRTVNALRGNPDAPGGYALRDGATFSGVVAGTVLTYNVVLRNDFVPQTASDQVFPAAVLITAGGYPVQRVPVWVLVPPR
ncbi:MAG: hypothetical protein U0325_25355 [Polyangiales bacterium]